MQKTENTMPTQHISMFHGFVRSALLAALLGCAWVATSVSAAQQQDLNLAALDPNFSPISQQNRPLLFKRLVAAFDNKYAAHLAKNPHKNLADGYTVYYLRQELQALLDIWRATGKSTYLENAHKLALKAIADAKANPRPLLWHNQQRGTWPCFYSKEIEKATGGHGQLYDFQGSAGFLMVADALKQAEQNDWKEIADFVEQSIVEKWLSCNPNTSPEQLKGPQSNMYLLSVLNTGRDTREHFAAICMDLHKLGYTKYPYKQWTLFLTELYLGIRPNLDTPAPGAALLTRNAPPDWGVVPDKSTGGYTWYFIPDWQSPNRLAVLDTSHANRTIWLAAAAYHEGFIDRSRLDGFINTLKLQVWAPSKGPFYFNNLIDRSDLEVQKMPPGRKGNLWFGWHRLAAYDQTLERLFLSISYDLTNGGPNIPQGAQNKGMEEAPLCFFAWGARLLSPNGQPQRFP